MKAGRGVRRVVTKVEAFRPTNLAYANVYEGRHLRVEFECGHVRLFPAGEKIVQGQKSRCLRCADGVAA